MNIIKPLKALSLLWLASISSALLAFITQITLARSLGASEYGLLSASLSATTLLSPLAGFGIGQLWLKIFGNEGIQGLRWIAPSFKFIKLSTTLTFSAILMWAIFGPHSIESTLILIVLIAHTGQLAYIELTSAKLQLEERYQSLSLLQISPHLLRLASLYVLLALSSTPINALQVAIIYAIVSTPTIIWGFVEMKKLSLCKLNLKGHKEHQTKIKEPRPTTKQVLFDALPFGMAATFHVIMFQINIILIGYLAGSKEAGVYNVAFAVMTAVYLTPSVIYQKFLLPKIHRWSMHDRKKFVDTYKKGNIAMLVFGIAAMFCILLFSPWAIPLFFGSQYESAVFVIQILSLCAPLRFLASSIGVVLVTQEHMKLKVRLMGISACFSTALSIVLINKYSVTGAAITTVLTDLLLTSLYYYFAQHKVINTKQPSTKKTEDLKHAN